MKKIFLHIVSFFTLSLLCLPFIVKAALVNCDGTNCTIQSLFNAFAGISNYILQIAAPLAILSITVGAILILISAGNSTLLGWGKKILTAAIIGFILAFGAYAIIDTLLNNIGYSGSWTTGP